jgi:hypothetical protein
MHGQGKCQNERIENLRIHEGPIRPFSPQGQKSSARMLPFRRCRSGQTGACARLHDLILSRLTATSIYHSIANFPRLTARKRRLRIFAASVRMTRYTE